MFSTMRGPGCGRLASTRMEPAHARASPGDDMTAPSKKKPAAIRAVIPFVFRHWLNQPVLALATAGSLPAATVTDLFMPVFSGRLVDALTRGAAEPAARHDAFAAFGA